MLWEKIMKKPLVGKMHWCFTVPLYHLDKKSVTTAHLHQFSYLYRKFSYNVQCMAFRIADPKFVLHVSSETLIVILNPCADAGAADSGRLLLSWQWSVTRLTCWLLSQGNSISSVLFLKNKHGVNAQALSHSPASVCVVQSSQGLLRESKIAKYKAIYWCLISFIPSMFYV